MKYARDSARNQVNGTGVVGIGMAIVPIPGTSVALTAAEARMVAKIAQIYGLKIESVMWPILLKAILLKLGGASLLKKIAMEGSLLLGLFALIVKPLIAGSVIKGIGEATIDFFETRFPDHIAYEKPLWEKFHNTFKDMTSEDTKTIYEYWLSL